MRRAELTAELSNFWRRLVAAAFNVGRALGTWVALAAGGLSTASLTSYALNWPPTFWANNRDWALPFTVILLMYAAVIGPATAIYQERERRAARLSQWLSYLAHTTVFAVSAAYPTADLRSLGAHVWRLKGQRVRRVAGFRVEPREDTTTSWPFGRGAVGQCWRSNQQINADLTALHTAAAAGEKAFDELPAEVRLDLSWADYQRTKRYWYVVAMPVRGESDQFIGCVTIDCVEAGDAGAFFAASLDAAVRGQLGIIQLVMREG